MTTAWVLDSSATSLSLPCRCTPDVPVSPRALEALGVFTRRVDAAALHARHPADEEGRTAAERLVWHLGYAAQQSVEAPRDEAREHFHLDEQMRIVERGAVFVDVRDAADRWLRLEAKAGEAVVIPRGLFHRLIPAAPEEEKEKEKEKEAEGPVRVLRLMRHATAFAPQERDGEWSEEAQAAVEEYRHYVAHPVTETVLGAANTTDNVCITSPSDFDVTVEEVKAKMGLGDVLVLLFKGAPNRKTHKSWCPPCVEAEPMVRRSVGVAREKSSKRVLYVECHVERCVYLGNPDHPYRTHPFIGIVSIPYLVVLRRDDGGFKEICREEDPGERYESWVNAI